MKIAGIIFLLFVSLSGMAQQAESPKEYVIKAWNEFQLPEKGAIKAILAQRDQITRYLKANNAAVEPNRRMVRRQFAGLQICMMKEKMLN